MRFQVVRGLHLDGTNTLMRAVQMKDITLVRQILDVKKSLPDVKNRSGQTPLMIAASFAAFRYLPHACGHGCQSHNTRPFWVERTPVCHESRITSQYGHAIGSEIQSPGAFAPPSTN